MNALARAVKQRRQAKAGKVGRPLKTPLSEWADSPIEPFQGIEDLLGRQLTELEQKTWLLAGLLDKEDIE